MGEPSSHLWFGALFLKRSDSWLDAYSTFQITDDDQLITKKQKDTPVVTLPRSDVKRIEEFLGKGFRIWTSDAARNIWVPCELEGYEVFKQHLLALPGVTVKIQTHSWLKSYIAIAAFLAVFAVSVLTQDKPIVVGASVALAGYLLFAFARHFRNPNLTAGRRRQLWWTAFIGSCFLVRAIIVWRS